MGSVEGLNAHKPQAGQKNFEVASTVGEKQPTFLSLSFWQHLFMEDWVLLWLTNWPNTLVD